MLLAHAVLLPALYFGLRAIARADHAEVFVDHVRSYVRMYADVLESHISDATATDLVASLDGVLLGGRCVYAAVHLDGDVILSSLLVPEDVDRFIEDFDIGENGDGVYYLSTPLRLGGTMATLQLGFDEGPTMEQFRREQRQIGYILAGYVFISLILVSLLSGGLVRPIQRLRRDSRAIASGDYSRQLRSLSNIYEVRELGRDLEAMRSNLVGVSERLQEEIVEREAAQAEKNRIEGQLHHAQRLQSIGTLAGGVAHEFNNILLPIVLYADLALEDLPADSPIRGRLERVISLANRAKGLSQQILTFGRQSTESTKVVLDIAPVVEEAVSLVRALVPANIEIRTHIEHNAGTVFCDGNEIQQLVVNLCSNAYLALAGTGGHMEVKVARRFVSREFAGKHARLSEGHYIELQVTDTGSGMDRATIERAFEPFFTTREVGKGSGLGLSVVHGIVVKHGGEILISSAPGRGTSVTVYFPIAGKQQALSGEGRAA